MLTVGAEPAGPAVGSEMRGGERSYRANSSESPFKDWITSLASSCAGRHRSRTFSPSLRYAQVMRVHWIFVWRPATMLDGFVGTQGRAART